MRKKENTFTKIQLYLLKNADPIEKQATALHITYLGKESTREGVINAYRDNHIRVVQEIANRLQTNDIEKDTAFFREYGEKIAQKSVHAGLRIEEAINGTVFVKQAMWDSLKREGFLEELSNQDFFEINKTITTYVDTLTSKIAFTYHHERQYTENNLRFLAEASKILSSSLDYQTTLNTVAMLAVPNIGDWCSVDMLGVDGTIQQVAVTHKDPKKITWAKELRKKQPIDMHAPTGVPNVLRTGKSELYPVITDDMLVTLSKTKEELKLARSIGFTSAMIVPIFAENKPIGAISFVTAETARHYNLADLLVAEELGIRASVAIQNARLYKGSQEAIGLRDDFISVASHELKTPVTSVKMFTQVLKKHSEQIGDMNAVNHLSKMDKQLNKLTELIYDLLNVSKIQAGRMEFRNETFDFDETVQEVVDILQQSSENHKLIIKGTTGKKVHGDQERIGQVINNLVSNAVKYSPKAARVIIQLSSDDTTIQVAVKDFGIGIEKIHLERIFERFYRVYDTTDKTFPGLGIGLYISSEIVKRHGGKFWVESNPGKGSTFYFTIPVDGT